MLWQIPVIFMVLAATAIPIQLRSPTHFAMDLRIHDTLDAIENVLCYVPVGIVLWGLGPVRAVLLAAGISMFAEGSQVIMLHRDPSLIDLLTNALGAAIGVVLRSRWDVLGPKLLIDGRRALLAATLALVLFFGIGASSGDVLSTNGSTSPGILEARWSLDEIDGTVAQDSSGHGRNGHFRGNPKHVAGVIAGAVQLDGKHDSIDVGHSSAFRLNGSMTISAWIHADSFPVDDTAIVSSRNMDEIGYQLDTTVDRGPRTIGFKLTDACGNSMTRYGATPLQAGAWYHVAGVYDSMARTLDVYLSGELDNGPLIGIVTSRQRTSRDSVHIGRRNISDEYNFRGAVDDVRIYSAALTQEQIISDMNGAEAASFPHIPRQMGTDFDNSDPSKDTGMGCSGTSESEDARLPGAAAAFGVLIAVAVAGLWPSGKPILFAAASLAAGLFLVPTLSPTLPSLTRWMMPLVSFAGGISVVVSLRLTESKPDAIRAPDVRQE